MFHIAEEDSQNSHDSYQRIRHDLNLGQAVLNAVDKCCRGGKEFMETGVPYDMVGLIVREKTNYRNVPNLEIQKSLKILQTQSLLIEVLPRHYKIL
ncbi:hypothetical protein HDU98_000225 [Podochytrium sp. JEL0797]|nr:hypothetical protein HDU98_000225 [Podochytrium sp. JEL0797]